MDYAASARELPPGLWDRLRLDPVRSPEHIALAAARTFGPQAERWAAEGRTVLFVSHNLVAVRSFCRRCLLLSAGRKIVEGPPDEVIDAYTRSVRGESRTSLADLTDRRGTGQLRFKEVILEAGG